MHPNHVSRLPENHPLRLGLKRSPTVESRLDALVEAIADVQTLGDVRNAAAVARSESRNDL